MTGRGVLPPGERSNAWTVALTPGGVVDYLNRKTSPLGAQISSSLWLLILAILAALSAPLVPLICGLLPCTSQLHMPALCPLRIGSCALAVKTLSRMSLMWR